MHRYIMYIGRARRGTNYSLRKRCQTYISDTRPKVARMIERWGKQLYLFFLPIYNTDEFIEKVERELIRVIIPPCNTQIPDHYVLPEEDLRFCVQYVDDTLAEIKNRFEQWKSGNPNAWKTHLAETTFQGYGNSAFSFAFDKELSQMGA